jgi:hypothetical protein
MPSVASDRTVTIDEPCNGSNTGGGNGGGGNTGGSEPSRGKKGSKKRKKGGRHGKGGGTGAGGDTGGEEPMDVGTSNGEAMPDAAARAEATKAAAAAAAAAAAEERQAAAEAAVAAAEGEAVGEENEDEWRLSGHAYLGRCVSRVFGKERSEPTVGRITRWLPASEGEGALYHVVHDDLDEVCYV